MAERACPAVCNNRARRLWSAYESAWKSWNQVDPLYRGDPPEQPRVNVTYGAPVFCGGCAALIRKCLVGLDELMALYALVADGHRAQNKRGDQVRSSRSAVSPSPVQDDLDELVRWLTAIETRYRDLNKWVTTPYRGTNAPALTSVVSWLTSHLDSVLQAPSVATEFGLGVLARHRGLQEKTSTKPPIYHKPLPCPGCYKFSLFRHDDEDVHCHNPACNRVMTLAEYSKHEWDAAAQLGTK